MGIKVITEEKKEFCEILSAIKFFLEDERIPENIRKEYRDRLSDHIN